MTQLRCRFAPAIFLIRDSGFTSMGPNLAKSTFGHGNRPSAAPPADDAAAPVDAADAPLITSFTNFCTSSLSTRSLGPLPFTRDRSTPSSRASARTDGEAWAFLKLSRSTGAAAPAGSLGAFLSGGEDGWGDGDAEGDGDGVGAVALAPAASFGAAAARAPAASMITITLPSLTLSPTLTFTSLITPAEGEGTSMVAFSDSSVTSESSALTPSPGLTRTSITGTSLKSPMSGTLTAILCVVPAGVLAAAPLSRCLGGAGAAGEVAAAGAGAVCAGEAALPPVAASASSVTMTLPSLTLSPSLTLTSLTTPAEGEGTSMVALSDSSVTSESSALTLSPALTRTSMTGTSVKSPMSGTLTSTVWGMMFLDGVETLADLSS